MDKNFMILLTVYLMVTTSCRANLMSEIEETLSGFGKSSVTLFLKNFVDSELLKKDYRNVEITTRGTMWLLLSAVKKNETKGFKIVINLQDMACTEDVFYVRSEFKHLKYSPKILLHNYHKKSKTYGFCVYEIPNFQKSLNSPLFKSKDTIEDVAKNTEEFTYIVYWLISAIYELNTSGKFLHGDPLPRSFVILTDINNQTNLSLKILDFSDTFNSISRAAYRPYSIDALGSELDMYWGFPCESDLKQGPACRAGYNYFFTQYVINKDYKEDAYALGLTLSMIYDKNKEYLDKTDGSVSVIVNRLIPGLKNYDITKRMTTKEALVKLTTNLSNREFYEIDETLIHHYDDPFEGYKANSLMLMKNAPGEPYKKKSEKASADKFAEAKDLKRKHEFYLANKEFLDTLSLADRRAKIDRFYLFHLRI